MTRHARHDARHIDGPRLWCEGLLELFRLRKFTQCLCYAREIKTYTLQGTAVVCFSQRWVNTNFGIIYNTLHVCTRLWLRYCACEKILQKYRSPKRRLYIRNRSIEHWIWLFWDVFLRIFKIRDLCHQRYSSYQNRGISPWAITTKFSRYDSTRSKFSTTYHGTTAVV